MRRWLAPSLAVLVMAASAGPALALLVWTLTVTPGTARAGTDTTFTLTATNLDALTELGCLEVDLPISFTLLGAGAGVASNGDEWEAVLFPQKVAVHSLSGGGRLELGQSVTFTILARPTTPGTYEWANHAHGDQDCGGAEEIGVALVLVVLPGNQATPSPVPTATPTPAATPTPTIPIGPLPSVLPTQPLPTLRPATPTPTARPASPVLSPSPTADASAAPAIVVAGTPPAGTGGAPVLVLAETEGSGGPVPEVALGLLAIDGISVWAIPGAIVGGPGLLVILWVMIQSGVALAWIPAVRRMRGNDGERPRKLSVQRRTLAL